ncbi:MAG: hypothetical protein KDI13_06805 [Alphaproteobacteria bacterium]|nr:hypothetical protein [Alphaproteobacteria bacterium]
MKKAVATICLVGSTLALAACGSTGETNVETAVPYTMDRTASYEHGASVAATPVQADAAQADTMFHKSQTK